MWLLLALIILWLPPPRFPRWTFFVTVQADTAPDDVGNTTHRRAKGSVWSPQRNVNSRGCVAPAYL